MFSRCTSYAPLGEEDITLALAAHQRQALTGERLLEEFACATSTFVREIHVALIGDHRSLARHERLAQPHAQQLGVLVRDRLGFFLAEPPVDEVTGDACEAVCLRGLPTGSGTALLNLGLRC